MWDIPSTCFKLALDCRPRAKVSTLELEIFYCPDFIYKSKNFQLQWLITCHPKSPTNHQQTLRGRCTTRLDRKQNMLKTNKNWIFIFLLASCWQTFSLQGISTFSYDNASMNRTRHVTIWPKLFCSSHHLSNVNRNEGKEERKEEKEKNNWEKFIRLRFFDYVANISMNVNEL